MLIGTLAFGGATGVHANTEGDNPTSTPSAACDPLKEDNCSPLEITKTMHDKEVRIITYEGSNTICAVTKVGRGGGSACTTTDSQEIMIMQGGSLNDDGSWTFDTVVVDPQKRIGGMRVDFKDDVSVSSPSMEGGLYAYGFYEKDPQDIVVIGKNATVLADIKLMEPPSTEPIDEPVDSDLPITNDFVEGANDFDHDKVKKDACNFELSEEFKDVPNPNPDSNCPPTPTP